MSFQKLVLVDDHIAGAKMEIGRYELKNGNYVGAIKNFQDVINGYSRTNQTPEAYFRLFEAHQRIGLIKISEHYLEELRKNYPDSKWNPS